jgi:hypothetical protein
MAQIIRFALLLTLLSVGFFGLRICGSIGRFVSAPMDASSSPLTP